MLKWGNALRLVVFDADPGVADTCDTGRHDGSGGFPVLVEEQADDLVFAQYAAVRAKHAAAARGDVERLREPRGFPAHDHHARGEGDAVFFATVVGGNSVHVRPCPGQSERVRPPSTGRLMPVM